MLNRRTFFRGAALGAAGLYLAPFIRQLEAASGKGKPARVLFFVQANGIYPQEIQPKDIPFPKKPQTLTDVSLQDIQLPLSLEPLQPWIDQLTMIQGLSGRIARGSHGMGFAALGCWPMGKKDYGETIDAGIARNLGGIYPHVGLGVSNRDMSLTYNVTSAGKGNALPTLLDPVLAQRHFFAAGAEGNARKAFDVDTKVLDFMADDVQRMNARLSGKERQKLERYLHAFEAMSDRQSKLANMSRAIAEARPEVDPQLANIISTKTAPTGIFDRLDAQFRIAAGTMIAGLTNMVTVSAGSGPDRIGLDCMASEIGKGSGFIGSHGIGHGRSAAGLSASECHALIRRKCMEKLASFIQTLESIPEGEGSMMDNTLIVYMSDAADSHHPGCSEWPFILLGDLGGRLRLGNRYLRYPWYGNSGHRTIASLYTSLLHAVGEPVKSFGIADSAIRDLDQTGPLAEIII